MDNNFKLKDVSFTDGGSMDDSGKCQLKKRFHYEIINNENSNRRRAILDLEALVPMKGSALGEDSRYVLKTASWNCADWESQSKDFYVDAIYQRASSDEFASAPWNLAPFNVSHSTIEQEVPFTFAYNRRNKRVIPVVTSAKDPISAVTTEFIHQTQFSFYAKKYKLENVIDFGNSVCSKSMRLLGRRYDAGTLYLLPFTVTCLVTFEDDGYTEKWRYYQVDMTIRFREGGWTRQLLNVGNRAIFNSTGVPESIYQIYAFNAATGQFNTIPSFVNRMTYQAHNASYQSYLRANQTLVGSLPDSIPYEIAESIPLTSAGTVDTNTINANITSPDYSGYPVKQYSEFRRLSWNALGLPTGIQNQWR